MDIWRTDGHAQEETASDVDARIGVQMLQVAAICQHKNGKH